MAIRLSIHLLNGRACLTSPPTVIKSDPTATVTAFKAKVEKKLKNPIAVLIPPFCCALENPERSLADCGLRDGHELRVILGHVPVLQLHVARHSYIQCIGRHTLGLWEQTAATAESMKEIGSPAPVTLFSTARAFAALYADGAVVAFGEANYGGDAGAVQDDLVSGAVRLVATDSAFAALCQPAVAAEAAAGADEAQPGRGHRVITWGDPESGGDSSSVRDSLSSGVVQVVGSRAAFAARMSSGKVVAWGNRVAGGNADDVRDQMEFGIVRVDVDGDSAFLALRDSGDIVRWGVWSKRPHRGGFRDEDLPAVARNTPDEDEDDT
mmetsp:Transcript_51950/g.96091  ORF Transcript_51950/g.96091 Transcript_51950/m.96091 type:complete len:324 (-) Transcript_51950:43-1014(-)